MKKTAIFLIDIYKATISPTLVRLFGDGCKFTPTCSVYTREAIEKFGVVRGTALGIKRFLRCHPFSHGYFDPVPETLK
jgi:uncharacterized protein